MITVQTPHVATPTRRTPMSDALRRHLALVLLCLLLGLGLGWFAGQQQAPSWTSTARVLINPAVGNPFAPAPTSVRQDELTSLETEAQVAGSAEVLSAVASANRPLTVGELQRGLSITVPPNTQILAISFTSDDPQVSEQVAGSIATLYLDNRDQRAADVNNERIKGVEQQTEVVVDDLRAATAAAQRGSAAERQFQSELASALRNQLVSLRAQRSYLENVDAPAGSLISPASSAARAGGLTSTIAIAVGGILGLGLGWAAALAREGLAGRVRTARDVTSRGLPVLVASGTRGRRPFRAREVESPDVIMRRIRAEVLQRVPTPEVIAVAPAAAGEPGPAVAAAIADSFARAGHRVVLVGGPEDGTRRGLGHALLHEQTRMADLLRPSADPLLKLVQWGLTDENRERLAHRSLRSALAPLVDAGHVVVLEAPDVTSVEGEAILGAADLGLVVVTAGRTRTRTLTEVTTRHQTWGTDLAALVLDERLATPGVVVEEEGPEPGTTSETGSDTVSKASERVARR